MNEQKDLQQDPQQNELVQSPKNIWITLVFIITSVLVVGCGIYVWEESNIKKIEQNLQQQISELETINKFTEQNLKQQISELETKLNEFTEQNLQQQISEPEIQSEDQNINNQEIDNTSVLDTKNTDDWILYEDATAGFSLKYPKDLMFNKDFRFNYPLLLTVESYKLGSINDPMTSKEKEEEDQQELIKGNYGRNFNFTIEESKKVIDLGSINGKEYMVLQEFDVSDIQFKRKLKFYHDGYTNDYAIYIVLSGDKYKIMSENPQYFIHQEETEHSNITEYWDSKNNKTNEFYKDLANDSLSGSAKVWYDLFDDIVDTIKIY
jgi:cell division protein ZapA (FtsZ GTPase activity inhibitor)